MAGEPVGKSVLRLWEMAQTNPLGGPPATLSDALEVSLHQYAGMLQETSQSAAQVQELETQLVSQLIAEPQGLLHLRQILQRYRELETLGDLPQALVDRQLQHLLSRPARRAWSGLRIRRGQDSLAWVGSVPGRITTALDLARSTTEPEQSLQVTQRLTSSEVQITIELAAAGGFLLFLQVNWLSPLISAADLSWEVQHTETEHTQRQAVDSDGNEFAGLSAGPYRLLLLTDQQTVDQTELLLEWETTDG